MNCTPGSWFWYHAKYRGLMYTTSWNVSPAKWPHMAPTTTYVEGNTTAYPVWTMFVPYVTAHVKTYEILACKTKSSITDWHSSITDIRFLLKTVLHNIPRSNWIIQRGRVISKMEVRQISCYHTNLADASTPSKIWDSHSGAYELCCCFWDVTLYTVVKDPDASIFKFRPWRWTLYIHPKRCYLSTRITTSHSTDTHFQNLC